MRPSMGSVGDCFDNALCESFFATLECELLVRRRFRTQVEARMAVFEFLEGWYNPHRRHSALGYLSPMEFGIRAGRWPICSEPRPGLKSTRQISPRRGSGESLTKKSFRLDGEDAFDIRLC